jgi:Na+/phosphate symporter
MYGGILVMSKKQQVVAWVGMISFGIGFFFFSMWAEDFFR